MESDFEPTVPTEPGMLLPEDWRVEIQLFPGFALPTSNTTYTPNQFFDVCLPHYSRGVVRLVAYMIRKTLGWCDRDGNPQEEHILIPYQELVEKAGIGRRMIRQAIDEAVEGKFIRCIRQGRPNQAGKSAVSALYALRWDDCGEYLKNPKQFKGFFEGEGHRTDIPNQFFDVVVPRETLTVVKVVGSIIRFSIGFQARQRRRQEAALSYQEIQNYARIRNRNDLSHALQTGLERNYIIRVEAGYFDPEAGRRSKAATYSLRWADYSGYEPNGAKNVPEAERCEKRTGNGAKNVPEERCEKRTGIQIKQINKTSKQQQGTEVPSGAAAVVGSVSFEKLKTVGFDDKTARWLAIKHPAAVIENQIGWIDARSPTRNRLGMLRQAIEENWLEPGGRKVALTQLPQPAIGAEFARNFYAGHAGNPDAPIAEPFARECEVAERFVKRLLAIQPDEGLVRSWGRSLGELARQRQSPRDNGRPSLILALHSHGDEFFRKHQLQQAKASAALREAAIDAHRQQFRPAWFDYLRNSAEERQTHHPDKWAQFEASQAAKREKIRRSSLLSRVENTLSSFDAEEEQLRAFQEFFAGDVLDFWRWDQRLNPTPFNAVALRP